MDSNHRFDDNSLQATESPAYSYHTFAAELWRQLN